MRFTIGSRSSLDAPGRNQPMDFDQDKVDDAVLALLWLTASGDQYGWRAWKGHDWGALDRLHQKGFISDPKSKSKSVVLTEEGVSESRRLFEELFGRGTAGARKKPKAASKAKLRRPGEDSQREERIAEEIIVDSYDGVERALGWYTYLDSNLGVPFTAECRVARPISPLKVGQQVEVIGMPPENECEREMFVTIRWRGTELAVPLAQLRPMDADDETTQAVEDWLYWSDRGHSFS
jgi:hypothetical protein